MAFQSCFLFLVWAVCTYSAQNTGELMWRLPVVKDYIEALESKCADINNAGGKGKGGSIIAAVFLNEFVEKVSQLS